MNPGHPVPVLAITMGDPAGIGPEILVKSLAAAGSKRAFVPVVIGSLDCLREASLSAGLELNFERVEQVGVAQPRSEAIAVLEPLPLDRTRVSPGIISAAAGRAALGYVEEAVKLAMSAAVDGMVTCPINKEAIALAGGDLGHQEIIARMTGARLTATLLMTRGLKVAHLSTHLSLADAVRHVRAPIIIDKLVLTHRSLSSWGIRNPRIAVAALNPHGGEGGLLGREEIDEIAPAVATANRHGVDARGPYPADSVFYRAIDGEFDVVLAMYHDQGHIAIKVHDFNNSITATMGIPFIRTSVDHGTAFEISGQNRASHRSLDIAIETALRMISGRLQ